MKRCRRSGIPHGVAVMCGSPLWALSAFAVDGEGEATPLRGAVLQSLSIHPRWDEQATLELAETAIAVRDACERIAAETGVRLLDTRLTDDDDGCHVAVWAELAPQEAALVGRVSDGFEQVVRDLNTTRGAKIAVFEVSFDDTEGRALMRRVEDFAFGASSCWLHPDLRENEVSVYNLICSTAYDLICRSRVQADV